MTAGLCHRIDRLSAKLVRKSRQLFSLKPAQIGRCSDLIEQRGTCRHNLRSGTVALGQMTRFSPAGQFILTRIEAGVMHWTGGIMTPAAFKATPRHGLEQ